ncbi:MAG: Rab family GTPase [Candidatus Hodarchaeales archaeon]
MDPNECRNEYLLKICAIGSSDLEKTTLIRRFAEGKFTTNYLPTLGVDITTKKIQVDDNNIKLILVDTAGQEFFGKLRPSYYRGASACTIFFSLHKRETFNAVPLWLKEFREHIPDASIPITLIAVSNCIPRKSYRMINKIKSINKKRIAFLDFILNYILIKHGLKLKKSRKKRKKRFILSEYEVSSAEAEKLAKSLGMRYCELYLENDICFKRCLKQLVRDALSVKANN